MSALPIVTNKGANNPSRNVGVFRCTSNPESLSVWRHNVAPGVTGVSDVDSETLALRKAERLLDLLPLMALSGPVDTVHRWARDRNADPRIAAVVAASVEGEVRK